MKTRSPERECAILDRAAWPNRSVSSLWRQSSELGFCAQECLGGVRQAGLEFLIRPVWRAFDEDGSDRAHTIPIRVFQLRRSPRAASFM